MSSCSLCALTSQDPFETHWLLRSASSAVTVPLSRNGNTNLGRRHLQAFHWNIKKSLKSEVRMNNRCLKLSDVACPNVPTHPQRIVDWDAADTCEFQHRWMNLWCITARGFWLQEQVQWTPLSPESNQPSIEYFFSGLDFSCSLCRVNLNSQGQMYMKIL